MFYHIFLGIFRPSLSADNPEEFELLNVRIVHCFGVISTPDPHDSFLLFKTSLWEQVHRADMSELHALAIVGPSEPGWSAEGGLIYQIAIVGIERTPDRAI